MHRTTPFAIAFLSLGVPLLAAAQSFSDTADQPSAAAVESLRARGVVEGYADGTFRPQASINRAEFLAILLRSEVGDAAINNFLARADVINFPDVYGGDWHWKYVAYARAMSIIDGYPDGRFRPDWTINLAETAKIAANVFRIEPLVTRCAPGARCRSEWWEPYVRALDQRGALPSDVWSNPERSLTRGEMATLTYVLSEPVPVTCVRAGCSGQVCVSSDVAYDVVTTCEWRDEYACYADARCEIQQDGQCGWTKTTALERCLRG
jgi:hypothetical protein